MAQSSDGGMVYRVVPDETEIRYAHRSLSRIKSRWYNATARAKQYGVIDTLTLEQWYEILNRSEGICYYCGWTFGVENLCPDHVIPMVQDGPNSANNVVPACEGCNLKKGDGAYPKSKFEEHYDPQDYQQIVSYHIYNFKRHARFAAGYTCQKAMIQGIDCHSLLDDCPVAFAADATLPITDTVLYVDSDGNLRKSQSRVKDFTESMVREMYYIHMDEAMNHLIKAQRFAHNLRCRYGVETEVNQISCDVVYGADLAADRSGDKAH